MLTFINPGFPRDPCKLNLVAVPDTATNDMVGSGITAGLMMTLMVPVCVAPLHTQEYCIESTMGEVLVAVVAVYQNSADALVKTVLAAVIRV